MKSFFIKEMFSIFEKYKQTNIFNIMKFTFLDQEEKAQIREYVIEYVTEEFNRTGGIDKSKMVQEIISDLKNAWVDYTIGIVTGTVNKTTDKLIYNIV